MGYNKNMSPYFAEKDNTFAKRKHGNVKRKIDIEVGDAKQAAMFYPQFKTKHWDNECNFSVRLKEDDYNGATIVNKGDKIEWSKDGKTARFYDKDDMTDEGGFEFEVEFDSKPQSNVVEYTLQHKGLRFDYQPELTQEEVDEGTIRPENVVGSYAVYHESKRHNNVLKEYRTGKAFHIFRPWAEDANKNRVWCELNIDEQNDLMTITVPQDFLDNAAYPVLVDPTFGYTTQGSTFFASDGVYYGHEMTGIDGTLTQMSAYVREPSASNLTDAQRFSISDSDTAYEANFVYDDTQAVSLTQNVVTLVDHTMTTPYVLAAADTIYFTAQSQFRGSIIVSRQIVGDTGASGTTAGSAFLSWASQPDRNYSVYVTYTEPLAGYAGVLQALGANHLWPCDGDLLDVIANLDFTNAGGAFTANPLTEDVTQSYRLDGTAETATAATDASVQDVTVDYCYTMWFQTDRIQQPPTRLFGDGGQTANNTFFLGFGNSIVAEADTDPDISQIGSDIALAASREYALTLIFRDIGSGNSQLEFLIDGVSQGTADVADIMNTGRGGFRIGGVTNTTTYTIGGTAFQLVSPVIGRYNMIATFTGTDVPTVTEVRENIFEQGAVPSVTIASDTEANMQTALNALASTVRPNEALNIRVEEVSGGGNLELDADNITHDALASIHVQYMGTGTLTWNNLNGSNGSIGSTPNGGNIVFNTPVTVSINTQDASTFTDIEGARVYITAAAGGPLPQGTVLFNDLTDVNGEISFPFDFSADQPIEGRARKASASPLYKNANIAGTITSNGLSQVVLMISDE